MGPAWGDLPRTLYLTGRSYVLAKILPKIFAKFEPK
jgi:hypothetical protein